MKAELCVTFVLMVNCREVLSFCIKSYLGGGWERGHGDQGRMGWDKGAMWVGFFICGD